MIAAAYMRKNWDPVRPRWAPSSEVAQFGAGAIHTNISENGRTVLVGTTNPVKLASIQVHLAAIGYAAQSIYVDCPETQGDLVEVAVNKWKSYSCGMRGVVLVEDSGLELSCLNGMPGPAGKDFLEHLGLKGILHLCDRMGDNRAAMSCCACIGDAAAGEWVALKSCDVGTLHPPDCDTAGGWDSIFHMEGKEASVKQLRAMGVGLQDCRYRVLRQAAALLSCSP